VVNSDQTSFLPDRYESMKADEVAAAAVVAATLGFAVIVYQGVAGERGLNFTLPMFLWRSGVPGRPSPQSG
jgi:hypothetical protein